MVGHNFTPRPKLFRVLFSGMGSEAGERSRMDWREACTFVRGAACLSWAKGGEV